MRRGPARRLGPGLLLALLASATACPFGCPVDFTGPGGESTPPPDGAGTFVITARPETAGAVRITSQPAAIDCLTNDSSVGDRCVEPFPGNTDLRLLAAPQVGHAFERWRFGPCDGSTSPECRFTVSRPDSVRAVTRVVDAACPVPPVAAFDRDVPANAPRPASYGPNLLANSSFSTSVAVGGWPSGFGYWRGDEAARAPSAQQGIVPRTGDGMLQLVSSAPTGPRADASAAEQMQFVDVSALAGDIADGLVVASASAWFARVGGCAAIDTRFNLILVAFDGEPAQANAKVSAGAWLERTVSALDVPLPATWQPATAVMRLPPGTTFVGVWLGAIENVANDATHPEFHGHYADDVALVLSR
ncbi:MAG: hypothetical protein AB7S39_16090 [Gemmatimonadales bacterium]